MSSRVPGLTARPFVRSAVAVSALGALVLTGCSGNSGEAQEGDGAASDGNKVTVVTSTNVYSELVEQIAGDHVEVEPIIDSAAQNPHSYEASPQDRLTIEKADVVILNGGGYDSFMEDMTTDSQKVINAVEISELHGNDQAAEAHDHSHEEEGHEGHSHDPGGFNEHVWYDLDTMQKLSNRVANDLAVLDEEYGDAFIENGRAVNDELDGMIEELESLKASGGYVATEPMPGYLLQDAGLHDDTPAEFMTAIDSESDVAPAVMKETTDLVTSGHIDLLAFNQQTSTGQTEKLRKDAEDSGVSVVEFSETVPEGKNYVEWMQDNIDRISQAVKN
ncbi:metal ABC transporter solute-binding protein, Zn/Mn family [Kocuria atrinae]|uniref:metal ABC transporter solute-binding protein, Zn/Mn family n=1 Tax=Kocuria atrinae TaxID=592377 RepID=UPI0003067DAE|nr:zinc ABC transporter substrate-binding protein [Kocuria atrinae]